MNLVPFDERKHYGLLSKWWEKHGWPAMPVHKLPPFGWMVETEEETLVGAFAYLDNGGTGVAMLEWTVGNPSASPKDLIKAMKTLFNFMSQELKRLEYDVIFTSCRQPGLVRIYESCGFSKTDEGMTHLVKITN